MKRLVSLLALSVFTFSILTLSASAQQQETLFSSPVEHGGFGGVVTKMTPIRGEMAAMFGGYGGWLIGHQFMIGGGGYGLVSNVRASAEAEQAYSLNNKPLYVDFGYGGLMLEYIIEPTRLLHVNVQTLIGGGSVNYRENVYEDLFDDDAGDHRFGNGDAVFVAEPAVNVELNVTDWFRVAAGASYRYVSSVSAIRGIENKDLSDVSGQLALKFGSF
jgi:hypothetical protein